MSTRVPRRTMRVAGASAAIALAVALVAATAYLRSLLGFVAYDDEGYMMLSVRHLLDGQPLYTRIDVYYGPLYFLEKWLLHGAFALPLTHTAVRLTYAATYVLTAGVGALAVFRMTRSLPVALVALILLQVPLGRFAFEPGHPQELAALLLAALPLAAAAAAPGRRGLFLGLLVGGLAMTKVNVGLFAALAVGLALLAPLRGAWGRTLQIGGVLVAAAVPWAVIWGGTAIGATPFAALVSCWTLGVATAAFGGERTRARGVEPAAVVLAATAAVAGLAAFACWKGASVSALWNSLLVRPRLMAGAADFAIPVVPDAWPAAIAALLGALAWAAARSIPSATTVVAVVQVGVGAVIWHQVGYQGLVEIAPPWAWLVLVGAQVGEQRPAPVARRVLAWLAVLQPLQYYPVPGSQAACAVIPALIAAVVMLSDGLSGVARALEPTIAPRAAAAARLLLLVCALWSASFTLFVTRIAFAGSTPLALPGAEQVRVRADDALTLRQLVAAVRERCTLLVTIPGFASLYFWSGVRPATIDLIPHTTLVIPADRMAALEATVRTTPGACVVRAPARPGFPLDPQVEGDLFAHLTLVQSIEGYDLFMRPADEPPPQLLMPAR